MWSSSGPSITRAEAPTNATAPYSQPASTVITEALGHRQEQAQAQAHAARSRGLHGPPWSGRGGRTEVAP